MVRCPKCNYDNGNTNTACKRCGHSLFSAEDNLQFYNNQKTWVQEQTQERGRGIVKIVIIGTVVAFVAMFLIMYFMYVFPNRAIPDQELTGTWSSPYYDLQFTFTSDGNMNGNKYQAKEGKIIQFPGSQFESVYSYKFMYATYQDGSRVKVLVLTINGTDHILHKTS